jgi:hypothetical protein
MKGIRVPTEDLFAGNPPTLDADFVDRLQSDIVRDGTGGDEGVVDRSRLAARSPLEVG